MRTCDKCGKIIVNGDTVWMYEYATLSRPNNVPVSVDLCEGCLSEYHDFIDDATKEWLGEDKDNIDEG